MAYHLELTAIPAAGTISLLYEQNKHITGELVFPQRHQTSGWYSWDVGPGLSGSKVFS